MAPRRFDAETRLLHPSVAEFKEKRPSGLATLVLRVFSALGLVRLSVDAQTGAITSTTNLTILNVFLLRLGPMREDSLTRVLMVTQVSRRVLNWRVLAGSVVAFRKPFGLRCWEATAPLRNP